MGLREWTSIYGGLGKLPEIAGRYQGKSLIICGDASCVWRDLELFGAADTEWPRGRVRKDGWDILTINKIVEVMPATVEHVYSNQPRVVYAALYARRDEYKREFTFNPHVHSCNAGATWLWPWGGFGTSALGACFVGLGCGYDRIVLCGVPLEDTPHNGEPHWRKTGFASSETAGSVNDDRDSYWKHAMKNGFDGKVRSMSGRTRAWLGDPLAWK